MEKIVGYFKNGFYLANKNLNLYLIALPIGWFIDLLTYLINSRSLSLMTFVLDMILIVNYLFYLAFNLSRPQFIEAQQNSHRLSPNFISKTVLKNARRLILPFLLLCIALVLLLVILFTTVFIITHPSPSQSAIWTENSVAWVNSLGILCVIILTLFGYTSLFFSLEKVGLIKSLKESFIYAWKHIPFTLAVAVVNGLIFAFFDLTSVGLAIHNSPFLWLHKALMSIVTYYINLITISALYLYYKSHPAQLKGQLKTH